MIPFWPRLPHCFLVSSSAYLHLKSLLRLTYFVQFSSFFYLNYIFSNPQFRFSVNMKALLIESFPQMCFEGKWLQTRLRADKNESMSFLAVDIQGHQRGSSAVSPMKALKIVITIQAIEALSSKKRDLLLKLCCTQSRIFLIETLAGYV